MAKVLATQTASVSLEEKVEFLSRAETYGDTGKVDVLETHMSWIFLTDKFVYKLKKPVCYDFLDFRTIELRCQFCTEEIIVNQPLAPEIYLDVVALRVRNGSLLLNGEGEIVDWLVKMKRLPEEYLLHESIRNDSIDLAQVQNAADLLVHFYLKSLPVRIDIGEYKNQIVHDIEKNSQALLQNTFRLPQSLIIGINTNLLHFLLVNAMLFEKRITEGRIIDGHGDLRPEHICLGPKPVIIDRLEFNKNLRIIDIVEELSFLALECEVLGSPATGQLFLNTYKSRSKDKVADNLIFFYKAKRAFLRAKLSIQHLLEEEYHRDEQKWRKRCENYLQIAANYCDKFS